MTRHINAVLREREKIVAVSIDILVLVVVC